MNGIYFEMKKMAEHVSENSNSEGKAPTNDGNNETTNNESKDYLPNIKDDPDKRQQLLMVLNKVLTQLCTVNDGIQMTPNNFTPFHSQSIPGISIQNYLKR